MRAENISRTIATLLLIPISIAAITPAQGNDAASEEALRKTQEMMRDPKLREKAILDGGAEAKRADSHLTSVTGNAQNSQEIYALAAEIFGDLAKEAGGDPLKLIEMIEKAKANPESFGNKLTPAQKEKLRKLSTAGKP